MGVGGTNPLAAEQSRDFPQQGTFQYPGASPQRQGVDPAVLRQLTGMGFPEYRATQACIATQNSGTAFTLTAALCPSFVRALAPDFRDLAVLFVSPRVIIPGAGRGIGRSGVHSLGRSFGDLGYFLGEVTEKLYNSKFERKPDEAPANQP